MPFFENFFERLKNLLDYIQQVFFYGQMTSIASRVPERSNVKLIGPSPKGVTVALRVRPVRSWARRFLSEVQNVRLSDHLSALIVRALRSSTRNVTEASMIGKESEPICRRSPGAPWCGLRVIVA